jgi:DNA-binding CsgD family transcriptional regulator
VHAALAAATDPAADPDRRAWHRAQAAAGTDEDVAADLERSAGRAQGRGGLAAAAAFLERAALLTPDSGRRAQRLLAAARAKRAAGALDAALGLLVVVDAGPLDERSSAQVQHLRGQIALDQGRASDAARLLLGAVKPMESFDAGLARETHLESLVAAMWAGELGRPGGARQAAEAARAAPPAPAPPRPVDVVLDAFALRFTQEYALFVPAYQRALRLLLALDAGNEANRWLWLTGRNAIGLIAVELCDAESWHAVAAAQVQFARDTGALVDLQFAVNYLAGALVVAGDLAAAERLIDEDRVIAEATGNPPVGITVMMLAAWRGQEAQARELIEAISQEAAASGVGLLVDFAGYVNSVLHNSLGRYHAARDAVRWVLEREPVGYGPLVVPELAEAAARTRDATLVRAAMEWLSGRARVTPTDWALGNEARARALLSDGEVAESCYRESIERLGRTPIRAQLARSHLLYGEWLRRERRRAEAREQLRTAHHMLEEMGMQAFAERARRELQATGETARKRTAPAARTAGVGAALTAQEAQVARLARDGLSNPEIGARLFISPRTAKYHLSSVFTKLGISSRGQLHGVLPSDPDTVTPY